MTGGAFFPTAHADDEEYDLDELGNERHAVQWIGTASVKGPKWARLPLLTVGMLGIQCVWSIEMGYASPYLLELGLSKSFMSLVFMAGPLSGLIVQPLIGIFADRSRNPLGRRRPFMLIGCAICVFAMMLLGWTREIAGIFGAGSWMAIGLAVWAIYLIDFSINAVMSTDRALVVDTLPPREQEEGSAWAGRMFGFGSVAGFFVGNLDLPPVFPFLGKTQLQILSFMTSAILIVTHTFTSWAVSERVLLRDDRPQSQSSLKSNLKSIWDNMFSLPPGIRMICFIQFFASLGWFPILFFTTVWVSEIYKASVPVPDGMDETTFASHAVRSGARALLLQALVNIVTSIGLPFLVDESGVQPESAHTVKDGSAWVLPIKGLTLVKIWWISQFVFAGAMAASWFVTTVTGAYIVIATTGFCWALSQWAPYSLLGELILIDGTIDRNQPLSMVRSRPSTDIRHSLALQRETALSFEPSRGGPPQSFNDNSFVIHDEEDEDERELGDGRNEDVPQRNKDVDDIKKDNLPGGLSPLVIQGENPAEPELGSTVILRHSDELSTDSLDDQQSQTHSQHRSSSNFNRVGSPMTPTSPRMYPPSQSHDNGGKNTADKAGVILGIHNVFLVLPQFVVTFLSSIIFYVMEPAPLPAHHPGPGTGVIPVHPNATDLSAAPAATDPTEGLEGIVEVATEVGGEIVRRLLKGRAEGMAGEGGSPDAVGLIFRIGGVSAAIGGYLCYRLARNWARGKGI
ncbi:solute carrier family 45, member 1/2/4 [Kwoniella heveanensis BCC8398]|uniref:Solute carrier family 45, member 1/2/4 n=1 Tax=Kwoniella heveanensis BCC8398 TaxID=1296120 RepID=A0A1B9GXS0_9TREE|nr:solute carrier family 45, member 1/2/4 [Kwoniella heveanensis BCC8398]